MPIVRTFACPECNLHIRQTLTAEQVDDPPPECPSCRGNQSMSQEFCAPAIVGKNSVRARDVALDIAAQDYKVADMDDEGRREGGRPGVRYKDDLRNGGNVKDNAKNNAFWGAPREALEAVIGQGRKDRIAYGSSLDAIREMPDLIAASKRRSAKVW